MNGRSAPFTTLILLIWTVIMCFAVAFTFNSAEEELSPVYNVMIKAANTAQKAMDEIKAEKLKRGIALCEEDIHETGMLGKYYSPITTTVGVLEAKRTTVNPNWAAVVVGMFRRANLREGDSVAMVFSGSFPALNICVMSAAQAYGLKQCVMASVGSSYYGANNEEFTFFDMAEHLYGKGILTHRLDCVSLGGASDVGRDFEDETVKQEIIGRIRRSGVIFIEESDYEKNIDLRIDYIKKKAPNVGFLINVGGSLVSLGSSDAFLQTGFVEPKPYNGVSGKRDKNCGLLQYYLARGLPVASLLNIKGLALDYGIPYDPVEKPRIGEGKTYYELHFSPVVPAVALALSVGICVFLCLYMRHGKTEEVKNERNYILCRRR